VSRPLATWTESGAQVEQVVYRGPPSHPQHELAKSQMSGADGIECHGAARAA
jgi:cystathionine beta-lyase/cystathionine gamma-synthase